MATPTWEGCTMHQRLRLSLSLLYLGVSTMLFPITKWLSECGSGVRACKLVWGISTPLSPLGSSQYRPVQHKWFETYQQEHHYKTKEEHLQGPLLSRMQTWMTTAMRPKNVVIKVTFPQFVLRLPRTVCPTVTSIDSMFVDRKGGVCKRGSKSRAPGPGITATLSQPTKSCKMPGGAR
ncbi:hypothetical protein B0J13DRAFT_540963 [Dactylonectria estremocensis]|uniref:Uncharacterized protein n=1 Tax=Dactylonectria estremocensis TaxID=1079267 RepID=A0A9P9JCI1_9HYPO|nr:hypothetical protein B0J13DRAFT_540963 [Dactylonectria estremocensis]